MLSGILRPMRLSHARRSAAPRLMAWAAARGGDGRARGVRSPAGGRRGWRPGGGGPGPVPGAAGRPPHPRDHRRGGHLAGAGRAGRAGLLLRHHLRRAGRCVQHRGLVRRSVHRRPRRSRPTTTSPPSRSPSTAGSSTGRATRTPSPSTWSIPAAPARATCASVPAWPPSRCGPSGRRVSRAAACGWSCRRATRPTSRAAPWPRASCPMAACCSRPSSTTRSPSSPTSRPSGPVPSPTGR